MENKDKEKSLKIRVALGLGIFVMALLASLGLEGSEENSNNFQVTPSGGISLDVEQATPEENIMGSSVTPGPTQPTNQVTPEPNPGPDTPWKSQQ